MFNCFTFSKMCSTRCGCVQHQDAQKGVVGTTTPAAVQAMGATAQQAQKGVVGTTTPVLVQTMAEENHPASATASMDIDSETSTQREAAMRTSDDDSNRGDSQLQHEMDMCDLDDASDSGDSELMKSKFYRVLMKSYGDEDDVPVYAKKAYMTLWHELKATKRELAQATEAIKKLRKSQQGKNQKLRRQVN